MTAALAFDSLGLRRAIIEWYAPDTARGVNQTFSLLDVAQDNAHDLLLLQLACRARGLACSSDTPPAGRLCCRGAVLPMRLMPTTRARPAETPDQHGAYPRLDDEQIEALSALGERRAAKEGEVLFREGDDPYDFYLVLAGLVAITQGTPPDEQLTVSPSLQWRSILTYLSGWAPTFADLPLMLINAWSHQRGMRR